MAGEHEDAMSRVDDLIAMVCNNSICYVIQACAWRNTTRYIPPLTCSVGIYASSPRELAYGES